MTEHNIFTERELEYLNCDVPMLSGADAAMRIIGAVFASLGSAILSPGAGKADEKLIRTVRELRYTKYKKAVLRKRDGAEKKSDEKLLKRLNQNDFVLAYETYDSDAYAEQLYAEYMKKHS